MIHPIRLGITLGIIWGLTMLILSLITNKKFGMSIFNALAEVYWGCSKNECWMLRARNVRYNYSG